MLEPTLEKDQEVLLNLQDSARRRIICGLRWDPVEEAEQAPDRELTRGGDTGAHDLDLLCIVFDKYGRFMEAVTGQEDHRTGDSGNIYHTGDVIDGEDYMDDEQLSLELFNLSSKIHQIFFIAEVQSAHTFGIVANSEIRLANAITNKNFAHAELGVRSGRDKNAYIFGSIYRTAGGTWTFRFVNEYFDAADVTDWAETLMPYLEIAKDAEGRPAKVIPAPASGETLPLHYTREARHRVLCGLNWDPGDGETYDLDLACVMYGADGEAVDGVSAKPDETMDSSGKVYHSGDDTGGEGDRTDDEAISVELKDLPDYIHHIVFVGEIQSAHTFGDIKNPSMRIADGKTNDDQLHTPLNAPEGKSKTAFVFARLSRKDDDWTITNIGEFFNGEDIEDWIDYLKRYL